MRTSLNEIQQAGKFLSGEMKPEESLLFRARLLVNPGLRLNVRLLKTTYSLIRYYGRKKLKSEFSAMHNELFSDRSRTQYQQEIHKLFLKN
jgi:hypothetical protein